MNMHIFRTIFTTIGKTRETKEHIFKKIAVCFCFSARPGRPPKRSSLASLPDAMEKLKKSRLDAADYAYLPARLMGRSDYAYSPARLIGRRHHARNS